MDIETKEAVLKLAGYVVRSMRVGRNVRFMSYQVITDAPPDQPVEILAQAINRPTVINLAYNTFLTRQNDAS